MEGQSNNSPMPIDEGKTSLPRTHEFLPPAGSVETNTSPESSVATQYSEVGQDKAVSCGDPLNSEVGES